MKGKTIPAPDLPKAATLIQRNHNGGFFSNLNAVLTVLDRHLHHDGVDAVVVDWRAESELAEFSYGRPGDGNLWLAFYEPLRFDHFPNRRVVHVGPAYYDATGMSAYAMYKLRPSWRRRYAAIYGRFVRPLPHIMAKVDAIASSFPPGSFRLGVHYRNPLHSVECPFPIPPPEIFVARARALLPKGRPFVVVLATDVSAAVPVFREAFGEALTIQGAVRRADGMTGGEDQIHHGSAEPARELGEQALVDCLLLARCDAVLHITSNLATAVGYINPALRMVYCETLLETMLGYAWSVRLFVRRARAERRFNRWTARAVRARRGTLR